VVIHLDLETFTNLVVNLTHYGYGSLATLVLGLDCAGLGRWGGVEMRYSKRGNCAYNNVWAKGG